MISFNFLLIQCATTSPAQCILPEQARWATVSTVAGDMPIAIYDKNDIVSNLVNRWEMLQSKILFSNTKKHDLFVDVGANIGVHSVRAAALGLDVIAVEPMWSNQQLLKATLCRNPSLNITVLPFAVGSHGSCDLYSGNINIGDCHLVCDGRPPKSSGRETYVYRGKTVVRPAHELIPPTTKILKVDTEGSECNIFDHIFFSPQNIVAEITFSGTEKCAHSFSRRFNCRSRKLPTDIVLNCPFLN